MKKLILLCVCLPLSVPCQAQIFTVDDDGPADFNNIQDAINYSWHGDIVMVKPGSYNENIYFNGRAITLQSTNPDDFNVVSQTHINGYQGYTEGAVVFDFMEGPDSILKGFTITGIIGVRCYASAPTIKKNFITACFRSGIYGAYAASPTICHNLITYNDGTIEDKLVVGGGIRGCHGLIANNIIGWNQTKEISGNTGYGGGLYDCQGTIKNNTIVNNSSHYGSAIADCHGSIVNNIIAYNETVHTVMGGSIYGSAENHHNCFFMNQGGHFAGGCFAGPGDFASDPFFNAPAKGDFHLKSATGRWDPNSQNWIQDDVNSPCIDAGDPNSEWTAEIWPHGQRINIGAYGGTPEASMSSSRLGNIADLNRDGIVNLIDYSYLIQHWQVEGILLSEDLNLDKHINSIDLSIFVDNWLWNQ
jgi:hypothetical protein